jgi:uncharacterized membrane protein YsdA (DUF1294 family)
MIHDPIIAALIGVLVVLIVCGFFLYLTERHPEDIARSAARTAAFLFITNILLGGILGALISLALRTMR